MKTTYAQHIAKNTKGRDFVIGDIHARKKSFFQALESVNFDFEKDRLFSLGDLIDRGKSPLVILYHLREDWFYAIRGNHEQMILNRFEFPLAKPPYMTGVQTRFEVAELHEKHNGGEWFGKLKESAQQTIYQMLVKLPYAITLETEFGTVGLVHAEVPERFNEWNEFLEDLENDASTRKEAIWNRLAIESVYHSSRTRYWDEQFQDEPRFIDGIDVTVHGHTMVHEPVVCGNQVWIDTGYATDQLTILQVDDLFRLI